MSLYNDMSCYRWDCDEIAKLVVEWRQYAGADKMCRRHAEMSKRWTKAILPVRYA